MSWSRLAFALFTTPVHTDLDCLSLLFSTAPHATLRHAMDRGEQLFEAHWSDLGSREARKALGLWLSEAFARELDL